MIFSSDINDHLEQVKIENQEEKEGVQWYIFLNSITIYDFFDKIKCIIKVEILTVGLFYHCVVFHH